MKTNISIKTTFAITAIAALTACTQPVTAQRILEDAGYSNVQMQGYGFLECGKNEIYRDKFTATGPTGRNVSGVVCTGLLFKGATIRLE